MKINTTEINKKLFLNQANQSKSNIKSHILKLYKELPENQAHISKNDLEKVLNNIWYYVEAEINKIYDNLFNAAEITSSNELRNKINYKIESNSELNNFTSKDIQDENKEITRHFQELASKNMAFEEDIENAKVAIFCENVAHISRTSYNASFKLLKAMEKKYTILKEDKLSLTDENFRKEFSFWIKTSEKDKNIFQEYKNILKQEIPLEINEIIYEENYLINLFYDLTLMYFHCHIAFPLVEINFKTEDNFDSRKMIDFINRGKNRKINFVIFPSLISNGCYLDNGKSWVFTYLKDTFKFEEDEIKALNKSLNSQKLNAQNNGNDVIIKVSWKNGTKYANIITNLEILRNKRVEYVFFLYNNNTGKSYRAITYLDYIDIEQNTEVVKCELRVDNKAIISSEKIINED